MDKFVETSGDKKSSGFGVILEPKSPAKKVRPLQLVNWFFTFNNYENKDVETLERVFKEICKEYIFQEEIGENGTRHLQGSIKLKKPMRWSEFGLPDKIHWQRTKNIENADAYCCKEETRAGKIFTNIKHLKETVKIKTIEKLKPWQENIEKFLLENEPDGRTLHWYWDSKGGKGKSSFCKYLYVKHKFITIQGGKLSDIMNIIFNLDMDETQAIIIDLPRNSGNKISYKAVECILNGMITNTKFETGIKYFNPPHVVVFANSEPDTSKLSNDRWIIKEL